MRVPCVSRETLKFTAAGVWAFAAIMVLARAVGWILGGGIPAVTAAAIGAGAGFVKSRLVFVPMANRNLRRIESLTASAECVSVLAFQNARSYVVIVFMIALGITLRFSPISRTILAGVYTAIGTALLLGSIHYLKPSSLSGESP